MRPGLTGLCQVLPPYYVFGTVEKSARRLEFNLRYVASASVLTDLAISLRAVPALTRNGAWRKHFLPPEKTKRFSVLIRRDEAVFRDQSDRAVRRTLHRKVGVLVLSVVPSVFNAPEPQQ